MGRFKGFVRFNRIFVQIEEKENDASFSLVYSISLAFSFNRTFRLHCANPKTSVLDDRRERFREFLHDKRTVRAKNDLPGDRRFASRRLADRTYIVVTSFMSTASNDVTGDQSPTLIHPVPSLQRR